MREGTTDIIFVYVSNNSPTPNPIYLDFFVYLQIKQNNYF